MTRRATLFLEGVTDSDPTSGDGAIWSPRLLAVAHNVGDYRYLRLRIDAQTTADGYFEIGACVLGPLALFGTPYSWGRVIDHQANVELTTARDGTRYARGLGDPRRQVSFSWSEGVDTSALAEHLLAGFFGQGLDISDPEAPVEIGWFDTTPYGENPPGFGGGAWTAWPFFESGMIVVSSMNEGLFIVRPQRPVT